MIWGDATIEDDGKLDPVVPEARETPVPDLPDECLGYLMGSRYCETDRLSQIAWDTFGKIPPGWGRVQTICDFVQAHIRFDYMQARATRTAFDAFHERVGVCRDFAHLAVTFCRCLNVPGRYVNDWATSVYRSSIQWISASGSRFSSRVRGIHSMRATTFQELAGSSSRVGATPPTSLSSIHSDLMS
jgi:transglutaminase-like putative cysteine protease